jgi:serine/threonine-protein kinase
MGHEPSGAPFLALELVDGIDLRAFARATGRAAGSGAHVPLFPDRVAVHIACALLKALGAVQRAVPGLVHRDVTPHNVLVSREGEVKLTDFGIALALDRARWTRPSVVKGKFGYVAPEQIRGDPLDARADLFACGVILFELLAGRRPWFAPYGTMDELRAIERGEIASILECRPRLDRALAMAADRLLALDPRDRFADADAALRAMAPFSAGDLGSLRLASILSGVRAAVPPPPTSRGDSVVARRGDTRSASSPDFAQVQARVSTGVSTSASTDVSTSVSTGVVHERSYPLDEADPRAAIGLPFAVAAVAPSGEGA